MFAYVHFGTSVCRLHFLIKCFSFILMHLSFDCIFYEVFLFYFICFKIAIAYRFLIRGLNIHMVSIHGEVIGHNNFLYYHIHNNLVKNFLIARCGHIFLPYLWMSSMIFAALTSFTRLEYWIHMVLMILQVIGQTSIKVAQHEHRATAVFVCGLNPAGWSVLRTQ